ncbi:MAG: DUF642 domain-containing protein [Gemmatimonas sp.]|uniref:DUF642 domain-containing protein n=1 Tax=Gemmatimonas sp. TaxID=1962908 RepID=UPI00391EE7DD
MITKRPCAALGALRGAPTAAYAQANLIRNGAVEQFTVPTNGDYRDHTGWIRMAPGSGNLTEWSIGAFGGGSGTMGIDLHLGTGDHLPRPAQHGTRMVDLNIDGTGGQGNGQGTISQTFATVLNSWYTLDFWLAGPSSGTSCPQGCTADPRLVVVDITGSPTQTFSVIASPSNAVKWYQQTFSFQANAEHTALTFSPAANTLNAGYWGAFIDHVSVRQGTVVPEPSTVALLAAGLVGLFAAQRRRRA